MKQKALGRKNGVTFKKKRGIKLFNKNFFSSNFKNFKTYKVVMSTDVVEFSTPEFDSQNIKFPIYELLSTNLNFVQLAKLYQAYKVRMVAFKAMPRMVNGTQPKVCWVTLDTQDTNNFNYAAMPQLQSSKVLNIKNNSTTYFRLSGRQDDFNYWYSPDKQEGPTASIRLRSLATPTTSAFWQFQIKFFVSFRQIRMPITSKSEDENVYLNNKVKKNENNEIKNVIKIDKSNLSEKNFITKEYKNQQVIDNVLKRNESSKNLELKQKNLEYIANEVIENFYQQELDNKVLKNKYTLEEYQEVEKNNYFKSLDSKSLILDWLGSVVVNGVFLIDYVITDRMKIVDILFKKIAKQKLDKFAKEYIIVDQLIAKYGTRENDEEDIE